MWHLIVLVLGLLISTAPSLRAGLRRASYGDTSATLSTKGCAHHSATAHGDPSLNSGVNATPEGSAFSPEPGRRVVESMRVVDEVINVNIAPAAHERAKTKILLVITHDDPVLQKIVGQLKQDLERSGQATVTVRQGVMPLKTTEVETLYKEGFPFVLFLAFNNTAQTVEGRLYDALDRSMLQGKKWHKRDSIVVWSHKIAQDIWSHLMGDPGSFISSIAYIKKMRRGSHWSTQLCVKPWASSEERVVRSGNKIMIAPCWKHDGKVLFFSEFTNRNVRLMATDLMRKTWVVVDGDGTNVGVSCIPQVDEAVYCHSGDIWSYRFDPIKKRGTHTLLIKDKGGCASPTQLGSGDIIYCAQGKIFLWSKAANKHQALTEGYCTGPSCHEKMGIIVYSKRVGKHMQLFMYDMRTKRHTPLTSDAGDKIDPAISPCGGFIAYCLERGRMSEIMVLTRATGQVERLSSLGDFCSCPAWSPVLA
jgi:Tol biopolymer transport system component